MIMVHATQRQRRRFDAVVNLYGFLCRGLMSGPITALAAAASRQKVTIFVRRMSGPCGVRKEGPRGREGSVSTLLTDKGLTMISPLISSLYVSSARSVLKVECNVCVLGNSKV